MSDDFWNPTYRYIFEDNTIRIKIDYSMNLVQLTAFKELLINYLGNPGTVQYSRKKGKTKYLRYWIDDISKIKIFKHNGNVQVNDHIKSFFYFEFEINANNFNSIDVIGYLKRGFKNNKEIEDTKKVLSNLVKSISEDIKKIIESVYASKTIERYYLTWLTIRLRDIVGYYDFNWIIIDGGARKVTANYDKVIKCKIKYFDIEIYNPYVNKNRIDTMQLHGSITTTLIKTFLRMDTTILGHNARYYAHYNLDKEYGEHELYDGVNGNFYKCNREFLAEEQKFFKLYGMEYVPNDTQTLFDIFYNLDIERQQTFIVSCSAYLEGLSRFVNEHVQGITSFISAIENLATFEAIKRKEEYKEKKVDKIEILFRQLLGNETSVKDFIDFIYGIRSKYVHRGIANNRIINSIFGVTDADSQQFALVEEVTNFLLIKWLLIQHIDNCA